MRVLNVGGGANRSLPVLFAGYEQHVLDIDHTLEPDICCDATQIPEHVDEATYDAVYCSHALEHFYAHDVSKVLRGFNHALKDGGKVYVAVPNLRELMREMHARNLELTDVWYRTGEGHAISFHDVLYGWSEAMERGNLFYAHKCGFTKGSLEASLVEAGFKNVKAEEQGANLVGLGVKPCL